MAKLKSNHSKKENPFVGIWVKVLIMFGIVLVLFCFVYFQFDGLSQGETGGFIELEDYDRDYLIPEGSNPEIVHHQYYSLGYKEAYEQAEWVCYVLNKRELQIPNVQRYDFFEIDDQVSTGSAHYKDYTRSGLTRGHLAPAGDMAFNSEAMRESFLMSNVSPQYKAFNGGIWRELEENTRDWAYKYERLYIVTGPIFGNVDTYIGKMNRVAVPQYFYKAILDIEGKDKKGIGFIMPNQKSAEPIAKFVVSIDEIERRTGLDLFGQLFDSEEMEKQIESDDDISQWPINKNRYRLRVNEWNNY